MVRRRQRFAMMRRARIRDDRGVSIILVAIFATVILFFCAIAIDLSNGRQVRRQAQNAADAAALAAAYQLPDNPATASAADFDPAIARVKSYAYKNFGVDATTGWTGCSDADQLVYTPDPGNSCISFNRDAPPVLPKVRVKIPTRAVGTFFGAIGGLMNINVTAVATAKKVATPSSAPPPTLLSLGMVTPKHAFETNGHGQVNVNGTIYVNSTDEDAFVCGSAGGSINADAIYIVGGTGNIGCGGGLTPDPPVTGATPIADPYASRTLPTRQQAQSICGSTCVINTDTVFEDTTIGPGVYNGKVTLKGDITVLPGVYYFNEEVVISADNVTGSDVLWYFTGLGELKTITVASGNLTLTGRLPTSTYPGFVMYADPLNTDDLDITNASTLNLTGIIYAPSSTVSINGGTVNPNPNLLMNIVADQIDIGSEGSLTISPYDTGGGPGDTATQLID